MTRIPKLLKIWLVSVIGVEILIWAFAFAAMRFDRRVELAKHWEVAVGTIVAVNPQQHLSITADYFVGGRRIQNTFQGSGKTVGDTIAIYYCPEDPNNADTENPASGLHRETWLLLLGGVLLGTVGALTIQISRGAGRALMV